MRWRLDAAVAAALVFVWALLWLATVPRGDFPLNDDWTYALAVKSVLETGRLALLPWSSANAFAQVYWGALFCKLFGFSYETLRVSTAVLGAVGLGATYGLLRELRAGVAVAALGALTVGCNPIYLSQSVTFMTDVPFVALVTLSLWLYAIGMRREWPLASWAAYGVGLVAVLVRQFAVVVPVAFAAAAMRRRRLSAGFVLVLAGSVLLFAALHLGYQKWMVATQRTSGFESPVSALLQLDVAAGIRRMRLILLPVVGLMGMAMLPFAIVDPGRFWPDARLLARRVTLGLMIALLATLYLEKAFPPLVGNVMEPFGIGPLTLTDTFFLRSRQPDMVGASWFWLVVGVGACWGAAVGVVAAVSLAAGLVRGRREGTEAQGQSAMMLAFIAAYASALLVFVVIAPLFDRYLLPLLVPAVAVIVLAGGGENRRPAALMFGGVLVTAMAGFSVMGTHDWIAWHRTRWEAVRLLEARSIPATTIDGGYEFNGLNTYQPVGPHHSGLPGWWVVGNEYVLAAGPIEGYREIASFPVHTWIWQDGARVVVLQRIEAAPQRGPPREEEGTKG